jgi:hypothetical protein
MRLGRKLEGQNVGAMGQPINYGPGKQSNNMGDGTQNVNYGEGSQYNAQNRYESIERNWRALIYVFGAGRVAARQLYIPSNARVVLCR